VTVIMLDRMLDPLVAQFNALQYAPRLLASLSPTCPECLYGAEVICQVIDVVPDLQALVIWLPMLDGDTSAATEQSAAAHAHPHVHSFADPQRIAGQYLAGRLGGGDWIAWDCYLLYPSGVAWEQDLPSPDQWFHQLDDGHADAARQRCGPHLLPALLGGVQRLAR
jgi:hypothetical protein